MSQSESTPSVKVAEVFLPKTTFPMRGDLPKQEPSWIAFWKTCDQGELYNLRRKERKGRPLFVLHDGPPYANGPIHVGHALNKILKDFLARWKSMQGFDVSFVPGWDCHGLPIEAQIEKDLLKEKKRRQDLSVPEFRQLCRAFAQKWIDEQREGFVRLGITAHWQAPYRTMDYGFEAGIMQAFFSMLKKGYVYRGLRPVLWSAEEQTALAEAEVEYQDVTSPSLYVSFPLVSSSLPLELEGQPVFAVIWTTTPWSLPGNRGISYSPEATYGFYKVASVTEDSLVKNGQILLLAQPLWPSFCQTAGIKEAQVIKVVQGEQLSCVMAHHPWWKQGFDFPVPLVPSEFVTTDMGTGLVHTAPCHGLEDFVIGMRHGLECANPLSKEGVFETSVPHLAGLFMHKAFPKIEAMLMESQTLLAKVSYVHSYPHSWRSKKPLFYRATPQWFIALDGPLNLRNHAMTSLEKIAWYPDAARSRMTSMLSRRPDWCISRQRVWGVPIATFVHKQSGEVLMDEQVNHALVQRVKTEGVDFWFTDQAWDVLEGRYHREDWVKNEDIIDVWFESGVTHEVVLGQDSPFRQDGENLWPADVYLEGSDQHRAWFQSSLATAVALQGKAPYKALVTHGFVLDEKGRKMSKSLGNVVDPQEVIGQKGADILRLWVAYEDYHQDVRIGRSILERVQDIYRRFRNTLRYLLGGLSGFTPDFWMDPCEMDPLHRWAHHKLKEVETVLLGDLKNYDFRKIIDRLHHFCAQDLSSFYFSACKDSLYCDVPGSRSHRQVQTTFFHLFLWINQWLSPFLAFTSEEAWQHFGQDILGLSPQEAGLCLKGDSLGFLALLREKNFWQPTSFWSVHLNLLKDVPEAWNQKDVATYIDLHRQVRSCVTGVLEKARQEDEKIKDALQLTVSLELPPCPLYAPWNGTLLADLCGVSFVELKEGTQQTMGEGKEGDLKDHVKVSLYMAEGEKCGRCWKRLKEVQPLSFWQRSEEKKPASSEEETTVDAKLCTRCWQACQK